MKMQKIKKSIDFSQDNYNHAELYSKSRGYKSINQLINDLVSSVLPISAEVRQSISELCVTKRQELLDTALDPNEAFKQAEINALVKQYELLEKFYGDGSVTPIQAQSTLKITKLAEGFGDAIYPRDWIVLNESDASQSQYAYIFEGRNGSHYGVGHYIYFGNSPAVTDELREKIFRLVRASSYNADKAFQSQVNEDVLIDGQFDADKLSAWKQSFTPGVFLMPVENAKNHIQFYSDNGYPFGAHIRRPEGYNFAQDDLLEI